MSITISEDTLLKIIEIIPERPFSTADFIDVFSVREKSLWEELVNHYGQGGKGAGQYYSSYSRVSQALNSLSKKEKLKKISEYRKAPKEANWGSPVIRYWTDSRPPVEQPFPESAIPPGKAGFEEGASKLVQVNAYERSYSARQKCISIHGTTCKVCQLDFGKVYGARGQGFIHVHHVKPLSEVKKSYQVDPEHDLVPVCPNCHAMIHRFQDNLSIDELRSIIQENSDRAL